MAGGDGLHRKPCGEARIHQAPARTLQSGGNYDSISGKDHRAAGQDAGKTAGSFPRFGGGFQWWGRWSCARRGRSKGRALTGGSRGLGKRGAMILVGERWFRPRRSKMSSLAVLLSSLWAIGRIV